MTSRGFHYPSQEVITGSFALKHPWEMTPGAAAAAWMGGTLEPTTVKFVLQPFPVPPNGAPKLHLH